MLKTGMDVKEPLGRKFMDNAEALARFALTQPVVTLDEAGLAVGAPAVGGGLPAILMPRQGWDITNRPIEGFIKAVKPRQAPKILAIAWIMTYLQLPSAPCILVKGGIDLPAYDGYERQCVSTALFSPKVFSKLDSETCNRELLALPDNRTCRSGFAGPDSESISLAAAGQARAWLHDWDGCLTNIVRNQDTKAVCLLDHEMAEPWDKRYWNGETMMQTVGVHQDTTALIRQGWETRRSLSSRIAYLDASKEAAARIHSLRPEDLRPLEQAFRKNGLPVPRKFLRSLLRRGQYFARPAVVTPYAERTGFNMGPGRTQQPTLRFG